jgi:hypothetical protein
MKSNFKILLFMIKILFYIPFLSLNYFIGGISLIFILKKGGVFYFR